MYLWTTGRVVVTVVPTNADISALVASRSLVSLARGCMYVLILFHDIWTLRPRHEEGRLDRGTIKLRKGRFGVFFVGMEAEGEGELFAQSPVQTFTLGFM